ncbi:MAG: DUF1343 domain-containing protein [Deltaproteobacteria bacterium]|nr:DUF1343 domain-containing protein [Deltaproteobacteria bacterium]
MITGLDRLLTNPERYLGQGRIGLCANPATIDISFNHALDLMHADKRINLTLLFGPEHGLRGDAQDMVSVADSYDAITGIPEVSLYGASESSLTPSAEQLARIDTLVIDIQDIGSRYYTYAATMAFCMQAAAKADVRVVVLDRPNPIGGMQIEGGGIEPGLENFCGLYSIPQRHGLTMGELARLYQKSYGLNCELTIIACEGWRRSQYFDDTQLPWVMPSPNMPTLDTAIVYPGMCLIEGTNISEGRGTTRPFELVGAPFINGRVLVEALNKLELDGVVFRPCVFRPTFHKHINQACGGVQLHVTDRQSFLPYRTGLAIIWCIKQLWPNFFGWRREPYEFRPDVPAIDLLTGTPRVRELIDSGADFNKVMKAAIFGGEQYDAQREQVFLYE